MITIGENAKFLISMVEPLPAGGAEPEDAVLVAVVDVALPPDEQAARVTATDASMMTATVRRRGTPEVSFGTGGRS